MPPIKPELQKAIDNIELYKKLIKDKVSTEKKRDNLLKLVDVVEETLLIAPASTRIDYHGAFPGGLVDHSLKVLKTMVSLNQSYEANQKAESLVVTALFHDIGKCGQPEAKYYLPKNSEWHNKQGIMFEINPDLTYMPVAQRSLYLLQQYEVPLSFEEFYAISSIKDKNRVGEENEFVRNEPMLAVILQQAIRITCIKNSGKTSLI